MELVPRTYSGLRRELKMMRKIEICTELLVISGFELVLNKPHQVDSGPQIIKIV
jgi:hypothetical protein